MTSPLRRHKSLIKLSREHNMGLFLALAMKSDTPPIKTMPATPEEKVTFLKAQFQNELQRHFKAEEEFLFPFAKGKTNEMDALIVELQDEHKVLAIKIDEIQNSTDLISDLDKIGNLLEMHIRKEERGLFQLIQVSFSEEELLILEKQLS